MIWIFSFMVIISFFFILKITCLQAYQTNKEIVKAYSASSLEEVIETYAQAYPKAIIGKQEIAEQLANLANDVANNPVPETTKKRYFVAAKTILSSEVKQYPDYARLWILYGNVLEAQGENIAAIKAYEKVQILAPKRQTNLIQLAMLYAKNKEFDKAQKLLQKTYLLELTNEEPLAYQALVYAVANQREKRSIIVSKLSEDALGRYISVVKYCFSITNDLPEYLTTFQRSFVNDFEEYYKEWANVAYSLKNYAQVETAVIAYRYRFAGYKFIVPNQNDLLRHRIQQRENPAFVFEKEE